MTVNALVSSAAYSLTDHFAASEGLAAFHIMEGLGKHDVRFQAVAANVLVRNMPSHLRTVEVRVPTDATLLDHNMLTLATGSYYLARNCLKSLSILLRDDIDIVHHMFPSNNVNFSLLPFLPGFVGKRPFIFGPVCGPEPLGLPHRHLFSRAHDANCARADAVIVQTKELEEMYAQRFGDGKVFRIPLGVEREFFQRYERPPSERFEVVTVANLRAVKGLDHLIRAMPEVAEVTRNVRLTIVGEGPERKNLEELIDRLHLQDTVALAGGVAHEDIKPYYERADLFCLPSMNEAFGKALVEAMACGVPVVSTSCQGPRQIVKEGLTGLLVPPGNPRALAGAINVLASDDGLRSRMSASAREAAKEYCWDTIVEKYWEVYRQFLES